MKYFSFNFLQKRGTAPSWGEDAVWGVAAAQKNNWGAFFTLGKQRQEEMKSLIQNGLQLGENMQTTEASNLIGIIEESIKTTTCV